MATVPPLNWEQASALAAVTVRHFRRLVEEGNAPSPTNSRFSVEEFARWLEARQRGTDFQAERTRLTKAQADKTELEVRELSGELVRADDVADAWAQKYAGLRARLLSWPSTVAQVVAPPGKAADVQSLAHRAVCEALNELAGDGLPKRTSSRRRAGAVGAAAAAAVDGERVGGSKPKAVKRVKRATGSVAH